MFNKSAGKFENIFGRMDAIEKIYIELFYQISLIINRHYDCLFYKWETELSGGF